MIHDISIGTNDLKRAKASYDPSMSLVGFRPLKLSDKAAHYGGPDIVFSPESPVNGLPATAGNGVHIAFQAPDRETDQAISSNRGKRRHPAARALRLRISMLKLKDQRPHGRSVMPFGFVADHAAPDAQHPPMHRASYCPFSQPERVSSQCTFEFHDRRHH